MTFTTIEADSIIALLSDAGEYELNRNKAKYEKQRKENESFLAKLEQEVKDIRADGFIVIDNPDSPESEKQIIRDKVNSKSAEVKQAHQEKDAIKLVLNRIDKMLDELVTKKNHEQLLKYLKSQGITTVEQLKSALSNNH
ncbi:hypothetical protein ACNE9Y_31340 [Pseudomonas sp. NY11226]|uniref:hypothetical protein n=1 Tax=Pseudomonas sp. NY11226 TaxID=3400362 RepID=UPI003A8928E7